MNDRTQGDTVRGCDQSHRQQVAVTGTPGDGGFNATDLDIGETAIVPAAGRRDADGLGRPGGGPLARWVAGQPQRRVRGPPVTSSSGT
jgi:hypothetical protein